MLLEAYYSIFLGGYPVADVNFAEGSAPNTSPYMGCVRDVIINTTVTDFNTIPYHTGIQLGTCVSIPEMPVVVDPVQPTVPSNVTSKLIV